MATEGILWVSGTTIAGDPIFEYVGEFHGVPWLRLWYSERVFPSTVCSMPSRFAPIYFFFCHDQLFVFVQNLQLSFRKKHYRQQDPLTPEDMWLPEVVLVLAYGCLAIQPELIQWKSGICGAPRIFHVLPGTRRTDFGDPSISDLVRFSPEKLPGLFNARNSVIWKLQRISYYEYLWYDILHF